MSIVLGIETSCDDTGVAIVNSDNKILYQSRISSNHEQYGGILPSLAFRSHSEAIKKILQEINNINYSIDAVAVTYGPGLKNSLFVGTYAAQTYAMIKNIPIYGVNHLIAHLYAVILEFPNIRYPFIGLVVSGAHSALYLVHSCTEVILLGDTTDDAPGECFDKVARMLGLSFPGGPIIDKIARNVKPTIKFPKVKIDGYNFSFSGLKSSIARFIENNKYVKIEDIAASAEYAIVNHIVEQIVRVTDKYNNNRVVLAGGVGANTLLRNKLSNLVELYTCSVELCTDNGVMVASLGMQLLDKKPSKYFEPDVSIDLEKVYTL